MREKFEKIYANNEWGQGSGEGSLPVHTKGYIKLLQGFIKKHSIKSVVDMGCGDWQFSRYVNWGETNYYGYDIVKSVVSANKEKYENNQIKFNLYSGDPLELPSADLFIAKDVLQHWSNSSIKTFLPMLKNYKYFLITNCINPHGETLNTDIEEGDFRYLDLRSEPFSLQAKIIYKFTNYQNLLDKILLKKPRWRKITLSNIKE